ncbi:MAG: hypothetical protein IJE82_03010, partial [Alphaproteobacteria bacterium]|nr:hypothetical protein [Alphaproteobacteria bacterium]
GAPANRRRCITTFDDINVQLLQGVELAKLWATEQYNDELVCSGKIDWTHGNDDFTNCMSITSDDPYYYTFRFDDLVESWDSTIEQSVKRTLCEKIYRGTFTGNYCSNMVSSKADKLVKNAPAFSIIAKKVKDTQVKFESMDQKYYTTQKINGIDPFAFYNGDIQLQANQSLKGIINAYLAMNLAYTISKFECNSNPFQVRSKIDGRSTQGTTDDVLTCYVNGTPVDFVFDDLSENWDTYSAGGYSNMSCVAVSGNYDGDRCNYITQTDCTKIRDQVKNSMPKDKLPYWNATTETCEMPSAAAAQQLSKTIDNTIMVGTVAVAIVVTAATAGTAGAVVLGTIEVAGGVIETIADNRIDTSVEDFLNQSLKCQDPTCAEAMLRANLQRMADFSNDITAARLNGVDGELERLANLIPADSEFYKQLAAQGGASTSVNNKGWDSWQPEEIWRAAGIAMGLGSLITGLFKGGVKYLNRATNALRNGARNAATATDDITDVARTSTHTTSSATNDATNAGRTANNTDTADNISDATHATTSGARTLTTAEKIEQARRTGNLGYHGTDADIAMDDMIRSSANSSDNLGSVGYGIAQDYSAAEKYAVKRLIERQNVGKNISFQMDANGNLVVQSTEPLNLSNKTGYVYTTAKRADMTWDTLNNGYVGPFKAAQMPESVEILEKTAVDLDDLIRRGKVKIDTPTPPTGATRAGANIADNMPLSGTALRTKASANFEQYLTDFKSTGANRGLPKNRMTDAEWARLNTELAGDNIRMVEYTDPKGNKYMKFERISNNSENINSATHAPKVQTPNTTSPINDFLAHSSTLQDLNSQGRLTFTTSSTLNGKQYMRISM